MAGSLDDSVPSTDELLAAYRARREKADKRPDVDIDEIMEPEGSAADATDEVVESVGTPAFDRPVDKEWVDLEAQSEVLVAEGSDVVEASPAPGKAPEEPTPEEPEPPASLPAEPAPVEPAPAKPEGPAAEAPRTTTPEPEEQESEEDDASSVALGPASPLLDLQDDLLQFPILGRKGSRLGRGFGIFFLALALVALAANRRERLLQDFTTVQGYGFLHLAGLCLVLGIILVAVFLFVPASKLRVKFHEDQDAEMRQVHTMSTENMVIGLVGIGFLMVGPLAVAVLYHTQSNVDMLHVGALAGISILGLLMMLVARARRPVLQRLVAQTYILQWIESSGIFDEESATSDPRVVHVLEALDQLLGSLPDADVKRFMATPEAQDYLDLIGEIRGGGSA